MKKTSFLPVFLFVQAVVLIYCNSGKNKELSNNYEPVQNDMVVVPAGWFWMGSNEGEQDEKPVHRVWLDTFFIDRFPVTNAQYALYLQASGHEKPLYWDNRKCNHPNQPVVGITWENAVEYCAWRSKKEQGQFTLPTEAQWEKAARGDDRRTYPWGNEKPNEKHAPTGIRERMPAVGVCELGRSPYGVSDLVGNVWNWCRDWYGKKYYTASSERNPQGPDIGRRKVVRGGNFVFLGCCSGTPAYALRTSRRNSFHPSIQKKSIGFRCVKNIQAVDSSAMAGTADDAH